jgi:hypothetical protein
VGAVLKTCVLAAALWANRYDTLLTNMVLKNFPVIIGLPLAAMAAFVVVVFFKQTETPMNVKLPGVELNGSSGEVFLWIVIFLAISSMIHLLWIN